MFAEELGVDPGLELQRLEQRVLIQDPELLAPEPAPPPPSPPALRRPLSSFIGRDEEVATLGQVLRTRRLVTVACGVPEVGSRVQPAATDT